MPRRAKTKAFHDLYWIPAGEVDKNWSGPGVLIGDPPEGFMQFYSGDFGLYWLPQASMDYMYYPRELEQVFHKLRLSRSPSGPLTVQLLDSLSGSRARTLDFVKFIRDTVSEFVKQRREAAEGW